MYNKLILTDCDGVLLDWEYAFNVWMNDKGYNLVDSMSYNVSKRYNISVADAASYVKIFNESATMGFLPHYAMQCIMLEKFMKNTVTSSE